VRQRVHLRSKSIGQCGGHDHIPPIIDPTKFYTRSTAPKEDAVNVEGNIPPEVVEAIRLLARDDRFPDYETPEDFMRDALIHMFAEVRDRVADPSIHDHLDRYLRKVAADEEALRADESRSN
jgi:hypothetical protein